MNRAPFLDRVNLASEGAAAIAAIVSGFSGDLVYNVVNYGAIGEQHKLNDKISDIETKQVDPAADAASWQGVQKTYEAHNLAVPDTVTHYLQADASQVATAQKQIATIQAEMPHPNPTQNE